MSKKRTFFARFPNKIRRKCDKKMHFFAWFLNKIRIKTCKKTHFFTRFSNKIRRKYAKKIDFFACLPLEINYKCIFPDPAKPEKTGPNPEKIDFLSGVFTVILKSVDTSILT